MPSAGIQVPMREPQHISFEGHAVQDPHQTLIPDHVIYSPTILLSKESRYRAPHVVREPTNRYQTFQFPIHNQIAEEDQKTFHFTYPDVSMAGNDEPQEIETIINRNDYNIQPERVQFAPNSGVELVDGIHGSSDLIFDAPIMSEIEDLVMEEEPVEEEAAEEEAPVEEEAVEEEAPVEEEAAPVEEEALEVLEEAPVEEEEAPVEEEASEEAPVEEEAKEEAAPVEEETSVDVIAPEEVLKALPEEEAASVEEAAPVEEKAEEEAAPVEEEAEEEAPVEEEATVEEDVLDNIAEVEEPVAEEDDSSDFVYNLSDMIEKPNEVASIPNTYQRDSYIWIKGPDGNPIPFKVSGQNVDGTYVGDSKE